MPEQAERKRDERPRRPVLRVLGIDPGERLADEAIGVSRRISGHVLRAPALTGLTRLTAFGPLQLVRSLQPF